MTVQELRTLSGNDYLVRLVFEGEGYLSEGQSAHVVQELTLRKQRGEIATYGPMAVALGYATPQDLNYTEYMLATLRSAPGNRKPLGYYILEQKLLKPSLLLEALEEQSQIGGRLGEIVVRNGWMSQPQVDSLLQLQAAA